MAVGVDDLRQALRVADGQDTEILTRILGASAALVEKEAPAAPEVVKDEAAIRVAGYLYDAPTSGSIAYANACRNSGAQLLLRPWVRRGAVVAGVGE